MNRGGAGALALWCAVQVIRVSGMIVTYTLYDAIKMHISQHITSFSQISLQRELVNNDVVAG
jgi:hypothetical protein